MISIIESKFETPLVAEVEALLLAHESRANRFCKQSFAPSINYTQGYVLPNSNDTSTRNNSNGGYGRGGGGRGNNGPCRGGGNGRGHGRHFANFQCQICLKYGHTANICFYKVIQIIILMSLLCSMIPRLYNLCRLVILSSTTELPTLG